MQGEKDFKPRLFYGINMLDFIGAGHFLVRLDEAISFEWVRERTRQYYSHTGRPSVDPVVLVKMLLVGYIYDIRSERRLVEEVSLNMAYRWYVGYDLDEAVPDHSIFSKARARFGKDLFCEIFAAILSECAQAGLVSGEALYIDSTLVKADASLDSLMEVSLSPEDYWGALDQDSEQKGESPSGGGGARSEQGAPFAGEVDEARMGKRVRRGNAAHRRKRSTTDPDATLYQQPGVPLMLAYKVHLAADSSGVITAVAASPSSDHDSSKIPDLLEKHEEALGLPGCVAADSHYGTGEALTYMQDKGIKTAVPPFGDRKRKTIPREAFRYDQEKDAYLCPEGNVLKRHCIDREKNRVRYRAREEDCADCPIRAACIANRRAKARTVTRSLSDVFDKAREFKGSSEGRAIYAKRKTLIEGLFGQAKTFHGLSRAKMRGLEKVKFQALMTASALNLKKLVLERSHSMTRRFSATDYFFDTLVKHSLLSAKR